MNRMIVLLLAGLFILACGGSPATPIADLLGQIGCEDCPRVKMEREVSKEDWVEGTSYLVSACMNQEDISTVYLWSAYDHGNNTREMVIIDFKRGPAWRNVRDSEDKCFLMNTTYEGPIPYTLAFHGSSAGAKARHPTFAVNDFVEIERGQHNKDNFLEN